MGVWSRGIALLLLASVATHGAHASLDSYAIDGNPRALSSAIPKERREGGGKRRLADAKSGKAAPPRAHHGGGGKHDVGTDGHHLGYNAAAAAVSDAKSGKAAAAPVEEDTATAATEAVMPAPETTTTGAAVVADDESSKVAAYSGKAGKSVASDSETWYPTTTDEAASEMATAGPHDAKSGKAGVAADYYEGPHGETPDVVVAADAKSGKAGYVMSTPTHTADAKTGKGPAMSYEPPAKGADGADAKSGKAAAEEMAFKPKAEKEELTHYFVKEPGSDGGKGAEAKSGKSAGGYDMSISGKAGKTGAHDGGKGGSDGGDDGWWSPGGPEAKASKTMSMLTAPPTEMAVPPPAPETPPPVVTPATPPPAPAVVVTTVAATEAPPPTDLLTLSPTPAPVANATEEEIVDPNARWWPEEDPDDEDVVACVFSADYPLAEDETIEQFLGDFLFETRAACCDAFPSGCSPTAAPTVMVAKVAAAPGTRSDPLSSDTAPPTGYPTYMPTSYEGQQLNAQGGENTRVLEPFGIRLFSSKADPAYDEEVVQGVTKGHLIHSFRAKEWEAESLQLMVLEEERRLGERTPRTLRWLGEHPVHELIFGGVLHFPPNAAAPTPEQAHEIVQASFAGERLEYYVELLREAGLDIDGAELDMDLVPTEGSADGNGGDGGGFNWAGLTIGLSSALVGLGLLAIGGKAYQKRRVKTLDELDLEKGDYAIRLQYTNDEMEGGYPGSTVAETMAASEDHLSLPSLVKGTPGAKTLSSTSTDEFGSVSPLESPGAAGSTAPTRYISVFTVKKDCGGKALEDIDLRALAVAYLSRMLRKFPNTHLLPYDKNAPLPAVTNIRNIPDDLDELRQYVGNARIDPKTGKVLFNLRVESDEPVSKMKAGGSGGSRSVGKFKSKTGQPSAGRVTTVKSGDEMEKEEMPRSPGTFEDVKL